MCAAGIASELRSRFDVKRTDTPETFDAFVLMDAYRLTSGALISSS